MLNASAFFVILALELALAKLDVRFLRDYFQSIILPAEVLKKPRQETLIQPRHYFVQL